MKFHDIVSPVLLLQSRAEALARLHDLNDRIEIAQARFQDSIGRAGGSKAGLVCPEGCGRCCEGFVPDVLPLEAEYLAAWLLHARPELAAAPPDGPPPCPFYDPENPAAHCSVYPARPLVCRLFAFAASRDREGSPAFALCRHMPELPSLRGRSWSGAELRELGGPTLPLMPDFAAELLAIDPSAADRRAPLGAALEAALGKIGLALSYAKAPGESGEGRDDDEPEPNAPEPRAA